MIVSIKTNIILRFTSLCFCRLRSISLCFASPRLTSPVQSSLLIFPSTMTSSRFQCPLPNQTVSLSIVYSVVTDFVELFEAKGICNLQK